MSSAQDPFYIVKEEIQESVSFSFFLRLVYGLDLLFVLQLLICSCNEFWGSLFVRLTSYNLLFTNGNGLLLMRESKCVLRRSCLLLVRALSGRY